MPDSQDADQPTADGLARSGAMRDVHIHDVHVRDMHTRDVTAVAAIEAASFGDAWPKRAFADLLEHTYARLRVAVDGTGSVCGYCVLLRAADEAEIANIATHPAWRGRGVGGALLDDALADADHAGAEAIFLEVRDSNVAALALYRSRGFVEVGRRQRYYQHPVEDALVMRRTRASA